MSDMHDIVNELTSAQLQEVHGGSGLLASGRYAGGVPIPPSDDKFTPPGYLEPVRPTGGLSDGVVLGS
jgi:hypothetical protein